MNSKIYLSCFFFILVLLGLKKEIGDLLLKKMHICTIVSSDFYLKH